jgi:hypothetical protein
MNRTLRVFCTGDAQTYIARLYGALYVGAGIRTHALDHVH